MTINDAIGSPKHVAVGPDHVSAAAAFGRGADEVFVSTYSTFEAEVDLTDVDALDLVADPAAAALLTRRGRAIVEQVGQLRIAVPRAEAAVLRVDLADALSAAGVQVGEVEALPEYVVLTLAPADDGSSAERIRTTTGLVLTAAEHSGRGESKPLVSPPQGVAEVGGQEPRPRPALLDALERMVHWQAGPRRRAALVVAAIVTVAGVVLLGLLPSTNRPLLIVGLCVLLAMMSIGFAWTVHTTLLLARQLDRQTDRLEDLIRREQARSRTRHQAATDQRAALADRVKFVEEYTQAVAAHSAAGDARIREVIEGLANSDLTR